jgi:hypothetical protein
VNSNRQLRRGMTTRTAFLRNARRITQPRCTSPRPGRAGFQPRRKDRAQRLHFACPEERRAANFPRAFVVASNFGSPLVFSGSCLSSSNRNTTEFKNPRNPLKTNHIPFSNRSNNPVVAVEKHAVTAATSLPVSNSAFPFSSSFEFRFCGDVWQTRKFETRGCSAQSSGRPH